MPSTRTADDSLPPPSRLNPRNALVCAKDGARQASRNLCIGFSPLVGWRGFRCGWPSLPLYQSAGSTQQQPVRFQNSAISPDLGFYVAHSYSLMRPPSTGRRWIRFRERSVTG